MPPSRPPAPPSPEQKPPFWKAPWFGTTAQWVVIGVALGTFLYTRYSDHAAEDFNLRVDQRADLKMQPLTNKIDNLKEKVDKIEGELAILVIKRASVDPTDPQVIAQVKTVFIQAKNQGKRIEPTLVVDAGKKLVNASLRTPEAWPAALSALDYQSFLNSSSALPTPLSPAPTEWHWEIAVHSPRLPETGPVGTITLTHSNFLVGRLFTGRMLHKWSK